MFIRQKGSRAKAAENRADNKIANNAENSEAASAHAAGDASPAADTRRPIHNNSTTVRTTAMIGATVKIKGDISSDENLLIEGQVEGTITLNSHELTVGQSGRVSANVNAKSIRIDGHVNGDLVGKEKIVISKTGNVRGNLVAPTVILEEGGKFKGSIDMGAAEAPIADFANAARAQRMNGEAKSADAASAVKHG